MGLFGRKGAFGSKMGLLEKINVLKGFLDTEKFIWIENGPFSQY